jgi:hypothetical protein
MLAPVLEDPATPRNKPSAPSDIFGDSELDEELQSMLRSARTTTQFGAMLIGSASPSNRSIASGNSFGIVDDSDLPLFNFESSESEDEDEELSDSNVIKETEYDYKDSARPFTIEISSDSESDVSTTSDSSDNEDDDGDEQPSEGEFNMIGDMVGGGLTCLLDPILGEDQFEESNVRKASGFSDAATQSYDPGARQPSYQFDSNGSTQSNDSDEDEADPLDTFMMHQSSKNYNHPKQSNDSGSFKRARFEDDDEEDYRRDHKRARYTDTREPVSAAELLRMAGEKLKTDFSRL